MLNNSADWQAEVNLRRVLPIRLSSDSIRCRVSYCIYIWSAVWSHMTIVELHWCQQSCCLLGYVMYIIWEKQERKIHLFNHYWEICIHLYTPIHKMCKCTSLNHHLFLAYSVSFYLNFTTITLTVFLLISERLIAKMSIFSKRGNWTTAWRYNALKELQAGNERKTLFTWKNMIEGGSESVNW